MRILAPRAPPNPSPRSWGSQPPTLLHGPVPPWMLSSWACLLPPSLPLSSYSKTCFLLFPKGPLEINFLHSPNRQRQREMHVFLPRLRLNCGFCRHTAPGHLVLHACCISISVGAAEGRGHTALGSAGPPASGGGLNLSQSLTLPAPANPWGLERKGKESKFK